MIRVADRLASVVFAAASGLVLVLIGATALGYRPLIDRSGSMHPAISAGDLLITHGAPASSVRVGSVVSFEDQALAGKLVTHRVVRVVPRSTGRLEFFTRGDANPVSESWSVSRSATVPKVVATIHGAGFGLAWMDDRLVRTLLLAPVALVLSAALLRRIWTA